MYSSTDITMYFNTNAVIGYTTLLFCFDSTRHNYRYGKRFRRVRFVNERFKASFLPM